MAVRDRSGTSPDVPTHPTLTGVNTPSPAPWYARTATTAGRPVVLSIALAMCAPGEYHLARLGGWSNPWALGMPAALSAYAGIAAVVAATRPKGARGRRSAIAGATIAIILALAAQVIAHEIDRGHMIGNQAWLIGIISAVPPAVVGHLLHLAATPTGTVTPVNGPSDLEFRPVERVEPTPITTPTEQLAPVIPPPPALPPVVPQAPAPIVYRFAACEAIRPLYNGGTRPATSTMRAAILASGYTGPDSDGYIRGTLRAEVERYEPHLAALPAEPVQLFAAAP